MFLQAIDSFYGLQKHVIFLPFVDAKK